MLAHTQTCMQTCRGAHAHTHMHTYSHAHTCIHTCTPAALHIHAGTQMHIQVPLLWTPKKASCQVTLSLYLEGQQDDGSAQLGGDGSVPGGRQVLHHGGRSVGPWVAPAWSYTAVGLRGSGLNGR